MTKKIIIVFKTHLDIGFTDTAGNVTENYMKNYLPNAMRVAKEMRGEKERFIWTTGSWLIEKFLEESEDRALLEDAIAHGDVCWHALPFTTHTELMDAELFEYGLGLSKKLDERFGKHTIAAKMTDVPGHTRAILPHMAKAGIKFMHIGTNPASPAPDVPPLFWWKAATGEQILMMYNSDYGQLTQIGDSGAAVYFAHTRDNVGPQSAEEIREIFRNLHEQYPEAEILGGTLDDVAEIALAQTGLPVVTEEIGDTWIYGAGSDPKKMSQFRALLRLKNVLDKEDCEAMYREFLPVPEHTWGLDEKTWLGTRTEQGLEWGETTSFPKEKFRELRGTEKFQHMEYSWNEQRQYVERAAAAVSEKAAPLVEKAMSECRRDPWNVEGYESVKAGAGVTEFELDGWRVAVDSHGAVCGLSKDGVTLADENHLLGAFSYEAFSADDYEVFFDEYSTCKDGWVREDFGKTGMENAISGHENYLPELTAVYVKGATAVIQTKLPEEAVEKFGGMRTLELVMTAGEKEVWFDFAWWGKEATRVAEGSWLQFNPLEKVQKVHKMDEWIAPEDVAVRGNRRLHAVNEGVQFETLKLTTLDAPLVSVGEKSLLRFPKTVPALNQGVYCNLHNNVWGTNFRMWYDEDARFRFALTWK